MNLLGYELTLRKKAVPQSLQTVSSSSYNSWYGPWWGVINESYAGAWQRNVVLAPTQDLLAFPPIFACVTGIASDIAKMRLKLSRIEEGIWTEVTENQPWLKVLRNPNRYQDHGLFIESWMISILLHGNAYILKQRNDLRGIVTGLYVLHPQCVKPLVAEDGAVYYEIRRDDLSQVKDQIIIPASEIIHDRMNTLWHPLVGVSPLYACALAGTLGNAIQNNATLFFQNASRPGGMLSAPGAIGNETAARLKRDFETNFSGENIGKLFVAGDGLEFKQFSIDAQHSQQVEQSDAVVKAVAQAFRYPQWKLGGPNPPYTKPDQAQTLYYTDCLGSHIVRVERRMDGGLELPPNLGTEFDLDELMRMDIGALYESNNLADKWMQKDEQRFRANFKPLKKGGNTVYLQHQDYPIEIIYDREDLGPKAESPEPSTPTMPELEEMPEEMSEENMKAMFKFFESDLEARSLASV